MLLKFSKHVCFFIEFSYILLLLLHKRTGISGICTVSVIVKPKLFGKSRTLGYTRSYNDVDY